MTPPAVETEPPADRWLAFFEGFSLFFERAADIAFTLALGALFVACCFAAWLGV